MAGDVKQKYGTEAQTITCTIASLAAGSARQSAVVDNTSNLFLDAAVFIGIKVTSPGSTDYANVYAYGTVDATTPLYTGGCTGSDASYSMSNPTNLKLLGVVKMPATGTFYAGPFSVAEAFGGVLPEKWGIVIENKCASVAFDATEANHKKLYQGDYVQYT